MGSGPLVNRGRGRAPNSNSNPEPQTGLQLVEQIDRAVQGNWARQRALINLIKHVLDQVQPALDRLDEDQLDGVGEEANQYRQRRRLARLAQITAPLRNPQQISLARD